MKQNILFTYTEEYLPTPRCRNIKTREVAASVCVNIKECKKEDAPLVMVVKKPHWETCEIRVFEGKLYRNVQKPSKDIVLIVNQKAESINWQNHIWSKRRATSMRFNTETDSEIVKNKVTERASELLIIDGMVFEKTIEPVYEIYFPINKKGGRLNINYISDLIEDPDDLYFSALERKECLDTYKHILASNPYAEDFSDMYNIIVLAPEYVKYKSHNRK